jgi:hypothetical protein
LRGRRIRLVKILSWPSWKCTPERKRRVAG